MLEAQIEVNSLGTVSEHYGGRPHAGDIISRTPITPPGCAVYNATTTQLKDKLDRQNCRARKIT